MILNTEPPKASAILYVSSAGFFFLGFMLIIIDMAVRQPEAQVDTMIELWEWNPFSQFGLGSLAQGLFLFWLGLITDKRGA